MSTRNPRASVERATALARSLGYRVRESDCRDIDGTVNLDIAGYGDLVEVWFKEHPTTGYLRFHRGFLHGSAMSGDWCTTWTATAELVTSIADGQRVDITPPELRGEGIAASVREGWVRDTTLDPREITDWPERQARATVPFEVVDGRPVNPAGPTGRIGRNLGAWGENAAADPIVVAGAGADRRVLLIRRGDCGHWAIPGRMVDPGETANVALIRELREETGLGYGGFAVSLLDRRVVDDPRNTDWAWIASTVALIAMDEIEPTAGSDATDARWWPFPNLDTLRAAVTAAGEQLYAAHEALLALVPNA
ncbi:NUDIX domain-containing protein [Parafrankia sp. FMc2]|uniref:NUDIX domain-containing protein n=1 Tax=Parafrankia sp. FMc2 TaxID=3233196 RepID=UPI0034D76BE3